ncbi:hypothetical protein BV898_15527 [Hypsibius exemplaris]|uniref:Receptor ligand binding region domain-containing protein n=1 Tax=Hypsibius exemplaris TaxID=2072580 RepID=A0A9X6NBP4_HYPEX|nr:hypothetical protein BV898_15527 [Hypsibius exemplaris]
MNSSNFNTTGRVLQVEIITMALTYPLRLGVLAYVGPAFDSARNDIRNKYPLLNVTQTLIHGGNAPYSDWLAQYENILAFYYYRKRPFSPERLPDVTAIVMAGADDTIGVGQFATQLDKLFITSVAQAPDVRNKEKWPTWITTSGISRTAFRMMFENLVRMFSWSIVSIVCDVNSNSFFENVSDYIKQVLLSTLPNAQVTRLVFDSRKSDMDYEKLLQFIKNTSRVVLYWGHSGALHKLLITAARINMTQGDYVFLAFLPFRHVSFGNFGWDVPDNSSAENDAGFKCLLIIESLPVRGKGQGENITQMQSQWMKRSKELDNNTYIPGETVSPHPMSTYMSMMALAEVVDDIRQEIATSSHVSADEFSGRKIAARFMNRTFSMSEQTESLTIDKVGERIVPMAVTQLDTETGKISVVLEQDARLRLRSAGRVVWPNVWPVPNRPLCGFRGEASACQKNEYSRLQYGVGSGMALLLAIMITSVLVYLRLVQSRRSADIWWVMEPILLRVSSTQNNKLADSRR